ncbi:hypothetical protein [Bacteroides xylanisolvens]|uniref:hypothetical protein n=1 Tax=Bacteroides xylanisolvens TaxID=371601 RepID=UPI001C8BAB69|nr:hypothetical protein [Bacteroides xylanisolvens]MBX9093491.1 hypothetical protein [Bacteroides xylanisolvens]MBX9167359.1 hypothetical protein [Bacteroides xylanisolvens]
MSPWAGPHTSTRPTARPWANGHRQETDSSDLNPIVQGWMTYDGNTRLMWFMQTLNGRPAR